jgi:hypothetical protein
MQYFAGASVAHKLFAVDGIFSPVPQIQALCSYFQSMYMFLPSTKLCVILNKHIFQHDMFIAVSQFSHIFAASLMPSNCIIDVNDMLPINQFEIPINYV